MGVGALPAPLHCAKDFGPATRGQLLKLNMAVRGVGLTRNERYCPNDAATVANRPSAPEVWIVLISQEDGQLFLS